MLVNQKTKFNLPKVGASIVAFPRKNTWGELVCRSKPLKTNILHFYTLARKNTFSKTAFSRLI
jgi:hypothetical protein